MTTSWHDVRQAAPALASRVEASFAAHRHHVLATLRADGSPRVTGLEVAFLGGEVWLGMIWHSRKALDLRRDARLAVHANPGPGADLLAGDARFGGRAVEVTEGPARAAYIAEIKPPQPFHLFRIDVSDVTHTLIIDGDLRLWTWRPGGGPRTVWPHGRAASGASGGSRDTGQEAGEGC
ncbi:pyridoxamine 5'-phosphate oxidase family protein [Streptomyces sp. NPDC057702]|uniref:pyridoxamine 5'-phosphate oxidase family protein n=1 Tax=unclassified Streptomyces TaxID=2593676 RepID=UPI00368D3E61